MNMRGQIDLQLVFKTLLFLLVATLFFGVLKSFILESFELVSAPEAKESLNNTLAIIDVGEEGVETILDVGVAFQTN